MSESKLAIHGGTPAITTPIPFTSLGSEMIGAEEEANVLQVIRSKRLNRYEHAYDESFCGKLEKGLEEYLGAKHVLATVSASEAIDISLRALGIGPGDEVIVPVITWVTCATAIIANGAVPVVCQVDETLTMDTEDLERVITPRTKAIIPTHVHGFPANMERINAIAKKHNLLVVEDNAQCAGASFHGKKLATLSDAGALSFNFMKFMSAGDGGAIVTNRDDVYEFAVFFTGGAIFPKHKASLNLKRRLSPSTVLRMTELTGAVAFAQFQRLEKILGSMKAVRDTIERGISDCKSFKRGPSHDRAGEAGLSVPLLFPDEQSCTKFGEALRAEGVPMAVTRDHMHFFGAEVMTIMKTVMSHQPVSSGRAIWASAWDAMLQKVPMHPQFDPWKHPAYQGQIEYSQDLMAKSFAKIGKVMLIRMNPRLEPHHGEMIAAAIRKVDAALGA